MKWFRMYSDIIDDPKIAKISPKLWKFFTFLLAFSAELERGGNINLHKNDPIWRLRMRKKDFFFMVGELEKLDMVSLQDDNLHIINWSKRQYESDNSTLRVKRFRDKERNVSETLHETPPEQNRDRTEQKKKNIKKKKHSVFLPPSLDEIVKYSAEKNYSNFNAESFFNFYESKNWMVGKNKMQNWKAALSGWVARDNKTNEPTKDNYTYNEMLTINNGSTVGFEVIPGTKKWRKL